jgi:hypothetical protein
MILKNDYDYPNRVLFNNSYDLESTLDSDSIGKDNLSKNSPVTSKVFDGFR